MFQWSGAGEFGQPKLKASLSVNSKSWGVSIESD